MASKPGNPYSSKGKGKQAGKAMKSAAKKKSTKSAKSVKRPTRKVY